MYISDTYQLGSRVVDSSGYLSLHSTLESEALDSFPSIDTCHYLTQVARIIIHSIQSRVIYNFKYFEL